MIDEGMVIDELDDIRKCLIQPDVLVGIESALSKINSFLDSLTITDNDHEDYIEELMVADMNSRLLDNGHIYI